MITIKNFDMEFRKFSQRVIPTVRPLRTMRCNLVLCEDVLSPLGEAFLSKGPFYFSSAWFIDYNKIWAKESVTNIFVLDGVAYLHKNYGNGAPLKKVRSIYELLYVNRFSNTALTNALIDNPWLNNLARKPSILMSDQLHQLQEVSATTYEKLRNAIVENVSSDFTPRGMWGLDFMLRWKPIRETPKLDILEDLEFITLDEYIDSFNN